MSDALQKLREIGAQKIHENTHISKEHIQALLHGSFESLNRIQFLGFISILERDYEIKLDELKNDGLEYFNENRVDDDENSKVFITSKQKKNYKAIYITVAILIGLLAVIYSMTTSSQGEKTEVIDNSVINEVKTNIVDESNTTMEEMPVTEEKKVVLDEQPAIEKSFKVISKIKLWIGYIDLLEDKKYQKLFTGEIELDPTKEWLLSLGHGNVSFEIDGKLKEFHSKKNMRFLYKDGELKEINYKEFKHLNKGSGW